MASVPEWGVVALGACGSACILGAFVLVTFERTIEARTGLRTTADSAHYQVINLVGGVLAAASAFFSSAGALPLALLETLWAAIALIGLCQIALRRMRASGGDERRGVGEWTRRRVTNVASTDPSIGAVACPLPDSVGRSHGAVAEPVAAP